MHMAPELARLRPLSSPPRKRGSRAEQRLSCNIIRQIPPRRVGLLDKHELPSSPPFLDAFLPQFGVRHRGVKFGINEGMDAVLLGKTIDRSGNVFGNTTPQIACYPNIEGAISAVRKNIRAGLHTSFVDPLFPGSLDPRFRGGDGLLPLKALKSCRSRNAGCSRPDQGSPAEPFRW
jgi:hypothetical protein